ncbi:hypothetical protein IMCC1989_2762 [gamma proteobacterium IMCC1989]|nr:hypothetical protein IMCC1989_2762 [gamma proteobacterium IMCC1989]
MGLVRPLKQNRKNKNRKVANKEYALHSLWVIPTPLAPYSNTDDKVNNKPLTKKKG